MAPPAPTDAAEVARTAALLATLDRRAGAACPTCAAAPCGHEIVMSVALGYEDAPRCLACLGTALGKPAAALRDEVRAWIARRHCFSTGWAVATRAERQADDAHPACLWPAGRGGPAGADRPRVAAAPVAPVGIAAGRWDAGETGCGELVLELRQRLEALAPGALFHLVARDLGAPEDLPAWCGLTGHSLVAAAHPEYWIRRKEA